LRRTLPYYFRSYRQHLGAEGICLPDVVAVLALTHPELFTTQPAAVDVETSGEIASGATVYDRRTPTRWTSNVYTTLDVNAAGVLDAVLSGLERAAAVE
jgi:inosine-uridine nucleoside N-ribohydrolase